MTLILTSRSADGDVLGEDGDAALALLVVGVEDAVDHLLVVPEHVGGLQQPVDEGGLAVVDVGDDGDVADVGLIDGTCLPAENKTADCKGWAGESQRNIEGAPPAGLEDSPGETGGSASVFQHDEGDVVGLGDRAAPGGEALKEVADDLLRPAPPGFPEIFRAAVVIQHLVGGIHLLDVPVAQQQDLVAGMEGEPLLLAEGDPEIGPQEHALERDPVDLPRGGAEDQDGRDGRAQRPDVGAGDPEQPERHEHLLHAEADEGAVALVEEGPQVGLRAHAGEERLHDGHHDARPGAVPGGVADGHGQDVVLVKVKVVVVPAHLGGRLHAGGDGETRVFRQPGGQHGELEPPRVLQLLRLAVVFHLERPGLGLDGAGLELRRPGPQLGLHQAALFPLTPLFEPGDDQHQPHEPQGIGCIGPVGPPPGRPDDERQRSPRVVPDAVAVGALHPQHVPSGGQGGEHDRAAGAEIDPVPVEALELVGVPVFLGRGVIQGGEFERNDPVRVAQLDLVGVGDGPGEEGPAVGQGADGDRAAEELELGNDHGGPVAVVGDEVGLEDVEAVDAAEEHLAPAVLVERPAVELVALEPVGHGEAADGAGLRVVAGDARVGAEPEVAVAIFQDAVDDVVRQAVALAQGGESPGVRVHPVEAAAVGGDPQPARSVRVDAENEVVGEADRVLRVVPVARELPGRPVEAIQAAAVRAEPQPAGGVLERGPDVVVGNGGRVVRIAAVVDEAAGGGVPPVQPAAVRPHPDRVPAVPEDHPQLVVAEAGRIRGIVAEVPEGASLRIQPVQPAAVGRHPEGPVSVGPDHADGVVAQRPRVGRVVEVAGEVPAGPVQPVQAAVVGAHPQDAVGFLPEAPDDVVAQRVGIVGVVKVVDEPLLAKVAPAEAVAVGADPEDAGPVEVERVDAVARQAVRAVGGMQVPGERAVGIQAVQAAAVGARPEPAGLVQLEGHHDVAGQAQRIAGIVPLVLEPARGGVQAVEPAAERSDPQGSGRVLGDGPHVVVAQGVRIRRVVPVAGETTGGRIQAVEAAARGAGPDPARPCPRKGSGRRRG